MNNCCSNNTSGKAFPGKFACPQNNIDYIAVTKKTVLHHIKSPWDNNLSEEQYYFCDDPECEVVYFGLKGSRINKSELRTKVGIKEKGDDSLICYCFGVTKAETKQKPEIKIYVTKNTKENLCDCEIRNPSGRCCLKDFPRGH